MYLRLCAHLCEQFSRGERGCSGRVLMTTLVGQLLVHLLREFEMELTTSELGWSFENLKMYWHSEQHLEARVKRRSRV
jgi:hypothetical protein